MRFSLFGQTLLVSLAALARADDTCDPAPGESPFAASQFAGPEYPAEGSPEIQCDSRWTQGETIIGIEAWSAKFQVKAVRFKFSQSGWGPVRGSVPSSGEQAHQMKTWDVGSEVGIKIWNNKPDDGDPMDGVGRIIITQNGEDYFEVGAGAKKVGDEIIVDNAAGIIMGVKTRSGAWLSNIEFKMLKGKIVKTELVSIDLAEDLTAWNNDPEKIKSWNIGEVYIKNSNEIGGSNQTFLFTNVASRKVSKAVTSQVTNQWTAGVTVTVGGEVGIPFLAKGKVDVATKFEYQRQNMDSTTNTWSDDKDLSVTQGSGALNNMLQPQTAVHCTSEAVSGTFDSDYTGKMEATLSDGSKFTYKDLGSVNSVGWERASSECKEMPLSEVPENAIEASETTDQPKMVRKVRKVRGMGWFRF